MLEKDFNVENYNFADNVLPFPEVEENNKMPEIFVIEGEPDMLEKLETFSRQGIRSVPVLSKQEYLRLFSLNRIFVNLDLID